MSLGRAAIYYRVSTEKQDFESQRVAIEKWLLELPAEKRPKGEPKVFSDEGISGKTMNRPQFRQMLEDALNKRFDTIITYRLDRFSRHAATAIRLILDLDEAGVAFVSVTQPVLNLGHGMPFRKTILAAFAEIAEIERETIVARVRAGIEAAKKRGVKLGAPLKIDRDKQLTARRLQADGESYKTIARRLEVSVGTVHKLLKGEELAEGDPALPKS